MNSAIYKGFVRHRRFQPKQHKFQQSVFMLYLDLDELEDVFRHKRFWSLERKNIAYFKRQDYFDGKQSDLKQAVIQIVKEQTHIDITGPVILLTNIRYFGYVFNPISIYYCFDQNSQLLAMVLEVTNTPWKERHHYVLACDPESPKLRTVFSKQLHVSPFNSMNFNYQWLSTKPNKQLHIHMQNRTLESNELIFDATLSLTRSPISAFNLNTILVKYPFMTMHIVANIHWQALKLLIRRVPFYKHPDK